MGSNFWVNHTRFGQAFLGGDGHSDDELQQQLIQSKIDNLREETGIAKLNRLKLEAGQGFFKANAELDNQLAIKNSKVADLGISMHELMLEKERRLNTEEAASAPLRQRKQVADTSTAETGAKTGEVNLGTSRQLAIQGQLQTAGDVGKSFVGKDITDAELATYLKGIGAIGDSPADQAVMVGTARQKIEELKRSRDQDTQVFNQKMEESKALASDRRNQALGQHLDRAMKFAQLPIEQLQGIADEAIRRGEPIDPALHDAIAINKAGGLPGLAKYLTPEEKATQEGLGKAYAAQILKVAGSKGDVASAQSEEGSAVGQFIRDWRAVPFESKAGKVRAASKTLASDEATLESIRQQLDSAGKSEGKNSKSENKAGSSDPETAPVVSEKDYDKVPSGWYYRVSANNKPRRKP